MSLCKREGGGQKKLFTVTQNYLSGKLREKQLFKSSCCLWNKLGGEGNSIHLHCKVFIFKQRERKRYWGGGGHVYHVFFIATFCFLPVVPELPLGRKTNNKAASHRDERSSQWRETDFYK